MQQSAARSVSPVPATRRAYKSGQAVRRRDGRGGASDRLAAAAERQLVLAAKSGGPVEREQLVEAFVPLIASVARIYRGRAQIDRIELMQEGVVGLLRALERFDPELGTPFWMYASWWVRQAMQQLVSELSRSIVLSDRALRKLARIKDAQRETLRRDGRESSSADLAFVTGMSRDQIESLLAAERKPRALEEFIAGDHETGLTLGDLLDDPRAREAFEHIPCKLDIERLPNAMGALSEREQMIIRARFGLDGAERTLRELGAELGVSAERVRQIEAASLVKLRQTLL